MEQSELRIERLEGLVADLDARVALMERPVPAAQPPERARPVPRPPEPERAQAAPRVAATPPRLAAGSLSDWGMPTFRMPAGTKEFEDLVGGRMLAWVGGVAVLLGLVFLFALGISNGWIGEEARTALGASGSAALLVLGVWLHDRKARTDAALASVATGISGLFVAVTVAAQVYHLVPQLLAVVLAIGVGATATTLAVRWESRGIGMLGILGALGAPILAGVAGEGGTMVLLFVALASAAGVLLWLRWNWLALAAFVVATPQWVAYAVDGASALEAIAVLVAFAALGVAVAIGHDLRLKVERLHSVSAYLLVMNALAVAATGAVALGSMDPAAGKAWLVGVALVHLGVGLAGPRFAISRDLGLLSLAIGAVLADVAFGLIADGPVLAVGWAATGVGFAALVRRAQSAGADDSHAENLAHAGLGGHLALSLLSAASVADPAAVLAGHESLSMAGAAAVGALAAACLVSARIIPEERLQWRVFLDAAGLASVALLTALAVDGVQLVLIWVAEAVALGAIGRRNRDELTTCAAAVFLSLAAMHALAYEAPPISLVTGLAEPLAAVVALGAVASGALVLAGWVDSSWIALRNVLRGGGALTLLYLGSVGVVTPFEGSAALDSVLLSAHQQGQMVLSVFWGLVGVGTIVVGLQRDRGVLRLAGLGLLGVTVTKVFLLDLATMNSGYRVVSFIGIGLLLLVGAFVWQRLRPRALTDLRETPAGVR